MAGGSYTIGCLAGGGAYNPPYFVDTAADNFGFNSIILFGDVEAKVPITTRCKSKAETKTPKYGLYALFAYTYSRTYDNGLSDGLGSEVSAPFFPLPNWQHLDWALSQINLDNSFTGSVIYDLPFGHGKQFGNGWNGLTDAALGGFQLTLIERVSSGFPVPLIDSKNNSGTTFNTGGNDNNWNRPNQVSGCTTRITQNHGQLQWINTACFTAPPAGQLGNASRVPVSGPDFVNTDFSVIKNFALPRKEMGLNFRAEFFNLFNHPQFGSPGNDLGIATLSTTGVVTAANGFGAVSSTVNNPRLVQLALKLTF